MGAPGLDFETGETTNLNPAGGASLIRPTTEGAPSFRALGERVGGHTIILRRWQVARS
jgi:hypothetical protein